MMRLDMFITFILFGVYTSLFSDIVAEYFHYSHILMYGLSGGIIGGFILLMIKNIPGISSKTMNLKLAFVIIMINGGIFGIVGKYFDL
jgi:hypothetical protein